MQQCDRYDIINQTCDTITYDVWGNPVSVTNANGIEITSPTDIANIQPLRYRSYYYDSDSGFYYLQSRYYDPITHRFVNADGLVSTGTGVLGYNMFVYCVNNPVRFGDYSGERYDDLFTENKKARLEKGKFERRKSNQNGLCNYYINDNNSGSFQQSFDDFFKDVKARMDSIELNFGYGAGFHGTFTAGDFECSGGVRNTLLSLKINRNGLDFGNEGIYGCEFGPVGLYGGYYHSAFCPRYKEVGQHAPDTCPYAIKYNEGEPTLDIGIGVDLYIIQGFNFSIIWNEDIYKEIIGE